MKANGHLPTFNLKAVVQETGLKPDTLRAWERRYGLPKPKRTDGGHRLYSQRDIDILKWLTSRQHDGMSISRAINLWHQLEAEGRNPLAMSEFTDEVPSTLPPVYTGGEKTKELTMAWVDACLAFDEQKSEQILNQAFALYSPEVVCFEVLQTALTEIGEAWHRGQITVQQEHFASALALRKLEGLVSASPPPSRSGRFLVGCAPHEEHTFNSLLVTFLLRRHGWEALYLGADVPADRIEETVNQIKPQLVILSAQQLHTAATLREVALILQAANVPLAYGGLVFNLWPAIRRRIPGYFLGERLDLIPQAVDKLLKGVQEVPAEEPLEEFWRVALDGFRQHRATIEALVWRAYEQHDSVTYNYVSSACAALARNIEAGLELGNVEYVGTNLGWIKGLFVDKSLTTEELVVFLKIYRQAVNDQMAKAGQPIVAWLADLLKSKNEA
ncbi:MAG TPA: MerR family transcriptional regulator [Anaerolineae bacterium]|nr:MerR family transcriptional regulator [Anaerolineae bacterium]HMR64145.1 MerR family transcriptional regulator [Anaerolineae bacterium]